MTLTFHARLSSPSITCFIHGLQVSTYYLRIPLCLYLKKKRRGLLCLDIPFRKSLDHSMKTEHTAYDAIMFAIEKHVS